MYGTPNGPCPSDDDGEAGDLGAAATVPPHPGTAATARLGAGAGSAGGGEAAAAWPGFRTAAQLLSMLSCNCHTVCDDELRPLGLALYPTGALVNHSCQPSAVQTFQGNKLRLRWNAGDGDGDGDGMVPYAVMHHRGGIVAGGRDQAGPGAAGEHQGAPRGGAGRGIAMVAMTAGVDCLRLVPADRVGTESGPHGAPT
jgi:hypothetical protein